MSKIRIRKRGKTFSYSFDISKNPRRMKEKGGFATEDDAFDAGVKAYTDWKSGNIGITSERVKLRDYLASWLENVVRPNVKRTTFKSYHNAIGSRITPQIGDGDIYLQELRPRDIDLWVNELAHAGLSQGTIRQTALYRLGLNSHSFRHTHATRLIESGAKPVDVAARLGHADATITQNLYAHDTDDMQQETARIFERFVDNGCM